MIKIVLSTNNPSKAVQIRSLLAGLPIELLMRSEAGRQGVAEENGTTLAENARAKAQFDWREGDGYWTLADDTGLFVDALAGWPGVHSARWAGEDTPTEEIMRRMLEKMQHIPEGERMAAFKTVAVLINPQGDAHFCSGIVHGSMLLAPRTACQPKMPYSALFVPAGQEKSWAEMTTEEENQISHRGQAFRQVRDFLQKELAQKS